MSCKVCSLEGSFPYFHFDGTNGKEIADWSKCFLDYLSSSNILLIPNRAGQLQVPVDTIIVKVSDRNYMVFGPTEFKRIFKVSDNKALKAPKRKYDEAEIIEEPTITEIKLLESPNDKIVEVRDNDNSLSNSDSSIILFFRKITKITKSIINRRST